MSEGLANSAALVIGGVIVGATSSLAVAFWRSSRRLLQRSESARASAALRSALILAATAAVFAIIVAFAPLQFSLFLFVSAAGAGYGLGEIASNLGTSGPVAGMPRDPDIWQGSLFRWLGATVLAGALTAMQTCAPFPPFGDVAGATATAVATRSAEPSPTSPTTQTPGATATQAIATPTEAPVTASPTATRTAEGTRTTAPTTPPPTQTAARIPAAVLSVAVGGIGTGSITSDPPGIACPPTCASPYPVGTVVDLRAQPDATSLFDGWAGQCSGVDACRITLTGAAQVSATFSYPTLTVYVSGLGDVVRDPMGIQCGATCGAYPVGTKISLIARPAAGQRFAGWSGACTGTLSCVVTLTQSTTVNAAFVAVFVLSLSKTGTGNGTVASTPDGIACDPTCRTATGSFDSGASVALNASPDANSLFGGWQGCTSIVTAPSGIVALPPTCIVSMTAARSVTVTFVRRSVRLTVSLTGLEGYVWSTPAGVSCDRPQYSRSATVCSATFATGTSITLSSKSPNDTIWVSGCTATSATTCVLKLDTDKLVTVDFKIG